MDKFIDNTEQFLNAVKTVALKAETASDAFNLVTWFITNVPYVEKGDDHFDLLSTLDNIAHFWEDNGCVEDELLPALGLAHAMFAHGWNREEDFNLLVALNSRCNKMLAEPDIEADIESFESFCDKYSAELNH